MPELPLHRGTRLERGLYLITPDEPDADRLLARTLPLLPFVTCLQLRNKAADAATLRRAGVILGTTYPKPIVDHAAARERALRALKSTQN